MDTYKYLLIEWGLQRVAAAIKHYYDFVINNKGI
jgi:hypothetical protein